MAARWHPSDIPDARLQAVLEKYVPPIIARSILERARREAISGPKVSWTDPNGLLDRIAVGVKTYGEPDEVPAILREISDLALLEREDGPTSHSFDVGPASSKKPSVSAAGALTAAARSSRDEPATRREPALGPPSSGSSPRRDGAAASWSVGSPPASPTSSTPHAAASTWSAGPPPASPPTHAATGAGWSGGSPTSPSAANLDASPASRREYDLGLPPRRAVDAPSASRGVFSTAGPRSSPTGASGSADTSAGAARVQIVRDGRPVPPAAPYAPPAAASYSSGTARSSPTPPAGMPRVPPTAREGSPAAAPRAPVQGLLPKAPGRIEITHASVPRPPPVPSRADIGIAMPRPQPKENAPKEVTITLASEHDIPLARQIARDICERLGTRALTQQRLLTIVSELGRNMVLYAGGGKMTLRPPTVKSRRIVVVAVDQGTGIPNLPEIMAGKYKSRSGLGLGLLGTKRLADSFNVETGRAGTTVSVEVIL